MIAISPATAEDLGDIQSIYSALGRPARLGIECAEYFIARSDSLTVGCAGVHVLKTAIGDVGYLFGLGVLKKFQRNGIGRALTEARLTRVTECGGVDAVALAMFWNVAFFRHLGFETIPRNELREEFGSLSDFCDPKYKRSAVMHRTLTT